MRIKPEWWPGKPRLRCHGMNSMFSLYFSGLYLSLGCWSQIKDFTGIIIMLCTHCFPRTASGIQAGARRGKQTGKAVWKMTGRGVACSSRRDEWGQLPQSNFIRQLLIFISPSPSVNMSHSSGSTRLHATLPAHPPPTDVTPCFSPDATFRGQSVCMDFYSVLLWIAPPKQTHLKMHIAWGQTRKKIFSRACANPR